MPPAASGALVEHPVVSSIAARTRATNFFISSFKLINLPSIEFTNLSFSLAALPSASPFAISVCICLTVSKLSIRALNTLPWYFPAIASPNPAFWTWVNLSHLPCNFVKISIVSINSPFFFTTLIPAYFCSAIAVLFNSIVPSCADVFTPPRLIAKDFKAFPTFSGFCIDSCAPATNAIESDKLTL